MAQRKNLLRVDYHHDTDTGMYENGYGRFEDGKTYQAHRYSYSIYKGKIPTGMCVCHTCDNTSCVNPDHLFIGTQKENVHDCIKKGRHINCSKQNILGGWGKSKYKGVCWHKTNKKWQSEIRHKNKRTYLGSFNDEIEAAKAYDSAAIEIYGDNAILNFK